MSLTTFAVPNRIDSATKHIHTTMTCFLLFLLALPHFFSLPFARFILILLFHFFWYDQQTVSDSMRFFHSCSSARLRLITTVRWISQFEIWAKAKRTMQYYCKMTAFGKCNSTFVSRFWITTNVQKKQRGKKSHTNFRVKHRKLHFIWNGFRFLSEKSAWMSEWKDMIMSYAPGPK